MMIVKLKRGSKALLLAFILMVAALPVSAGLFQWSRLGRLIPQTGFEPSVSVIAGHPTNRVVLYAGTLRSTDNTNLILKSTNGGISWQPTSNGLPTGLPQNTGVNDLIIRPDSPDTLYAGLYEAGVWRSLNGGQNWGNATNGSIAANDTIKALAIDPSRPSTVYGLTSSGVHVSVNGGVWQTRSAGLPAANEAIFNDLAADPVHAGTLYVTANPQGVYRSTNGGQSWSLATGGLPPGDLNVKGIVVSPVTGRAMISVGGQGLWRSDDMGGLWERSDSGITYNTTLSGSVGVPVFNPDRAGIAYVYNNDGVFASTDGGESWTPFNDGFSGAETVNTMAFHPAAPETVYAGTSVSGVWSLTVVPGGRYFVPVAIR